MISYSVATIAVDLVQNQLWRQPTEAEIEALGIPDVEACVEPVAEPFLHRWLHNFLGWALPTGKAEVKRPVARADHRIAL